MNHYCWRCYAVNKKPRGTCVECGGEIAAPTGTSYAELLVWELGHPLPDRQMLAAQVLGKLRDARARVPLRELASESADPYLAAQALQALLAIDGAAVHRPLLEQLVRVGAVPVRAAAAAALQELR
jgi:hypothetical protein